jgi:hypothetical protein
MKVIFDTKKKSIVIKDVLLDEYLEFVQTILKMDNRDSDNTSSTLDKNFKFNYLNVDCLGEIVCNCCADGNCDG